MALLSSWEHLQPWLAPEAAFADGEDLELRERLLHVATPARRCQGEYSLATLRAQFRELRGFDFPDSEATSDDELPELVD